MKYKNLIFGIVFDIFVATEPEMHTLRTALGPVLNRQFTLKIIHLPCLSLMHTWEVFSF